MCICCNVCICASGVCVYLCVCLCVCVHVWVHVCCLTHYHPSCRWRCFCGVHFLPLPAKWKRSTAWPLLTLWIMTRGKKQKKTSRNSSSQLVSVICFFITFADPPLPPPPPKNMYVSPFQLWNFLQGREPYPLFDEHKQPTEKIMNTTVIKRKSSTGGPQFLVCPLS